MPAADADVTALSASLSDLIAVIAPTSNQAGTLNAVAPDDLQHKLNGGTETRIGAHYVDVVVGERELPPNARLLDLGCGFGRVALDLANRLTDDQQYFGLDPNAEAIEWAGENIGSRRSNFHFDLIDVASKPYNPDGSESGERFVFPFADQSLDRVFMISVLTHVDLPTVRNYVEEAARTLKPDTGRLVATVFLLDREVDKLIAAGRSAYNLKWKTGESRVENRENPELVIAHPRARVLEILQDAGFENVAVRQGHWSGRPTEKIVDFQDTLIADFGTVTAAPPSAEDLARAQEYTRLARVLAHNGVSVERFAPFLVWATGASVNALRWEAQGITLDLSGGGADGEGEAEPQRLRLEQLRRINFDGCIPETTPAGGPVELGEPVEMGEYEELGETEVLGAVMEAAPALERPALVALLGELVHNGVLLERALRGGSAIQRGRGADRPAPIPLPATDALPKPLTARGVFSRLRAALRRR